MKGLNQTAQLSDGWMAIAPSTEGAKCKDWSVTQPACLLPLKPLLSLQAILPTSRKGHYNEFREVTQNPNFSYSKNKMPCIKKKESLGYEP